jgi:hypothetical protein
MMARSTQACPASVGRGFADDRDAIEIMMAIREPDFRTEAMAEKEIIKYEQVKN